MTLNLFKLFMTKSNNPTLTLSFKPKKEFMVCSTVSFRKSKQEIFLCLWASKKCQCSLRWVYQLKISLWKWLLIMDIQLRHHMYIPIFGRPMHQLSFSMTCSRSGERKVSLRKMLISLETSLKTLLLIFVSQSQSSKKNTLWVKYLTTIRYDINLEGVPKLKTNDRVPMFFPNPEKNWGPKKRAAPKLLWVFDVVVKGLIGELKVNQWQKVLIMKRLKILLIRNLKLNKYWFEGEVSFLNEIDIE